MGKFVSHKRKCSMRLRLERRLSNFGMPMVPISLEACLPQHLMKNNQPLKFFLQNKTLSRIAVFERENNMKRRVDMVVSFF